MPRKKLPNSLLMPHLAITLSMLIWAVAGPVIKITLRDIPVFTFLLYRFMLVGLVVLPYLLVKLIKDPIAKKDIPGIVILGLASQVSIMFIFLGLNFTTALDVAVISVLAPILTFIAGRYFYHEKITRMETLGISLAILGTLFIIIEPALSSGISAEIGKRLLGNFFILIYQFSWPVYTILGKHLVGKDSKELNKTFRFLHIKKLSKDYSPNTITAVSFYVGLAFFIPAAIIESTSTNYYPHFTFSALSGIIYMALLSSIVAYGVYQWGLKYLEAQETAVYAYLGSVFTVPAAYLLLGEVPTTGMLIGAGVITGISRRVIFITGPATAQINMDRVIARWGINKLLGSFFLGIK